MFKRVIGLIMVVCICVGIFTVVSAESASSGTCGNNAVWEFVDGTLTISGSGDMNVDYTPPWQNIKSQIKKVVIEDGITSISASAFGWCTQLESVSVGKDVKKIGSSAFMLCQKLESVELPSGITAIAYDAFSSTGISKNSDNWTDGVFYIGTYAIEGDEEQTPERLVIKDGTTFVDNLSACNNVKIVVLPESVTYFDSNSFNSSVIIEGVKGSAAETIATKVCYPFFEIGSESHILSGTYQNIVWEIDFDNRYLTLNGTGAMPGFSWSGEAPWGKYYDNIGTTEVKDGITSIADYSCFGEMIIIPESVTEIKQSFMQEVTICGVSGSFAECFANENGLMFRDQSGNITASGKCGENAEWKFNYNNHTLTISGSGAMHDYDYVYDCPFFSYNGLIDEIIIGDEITHLGKNAFNIFSYQGTWIILPDTIKELNMNAFPLGTGASKRIFYCPKGSYAASWAEENAEYYEIYDEYKEIRVETTEELLDAIASNRKIVVADGLYETDKQLMLEHRRNLSIVAENSGKAEILSNDGYRPVVTFKYSSNVAVSGLILGHRSLRYQQDACGTGSNSSGYVVYGYCSRYVTVNESDLYGCGTVGVYLYNTYGYKSNNCVIRDCKENIVTSNEAYYPDRERSRITAEFANCIISGNAYDDDFAERVAAMNVEGSTVTFDDCTFINNLSEVRDYDESLVKYADCIFEDNRWQGAATKDNGVCLNGITWQVEPGVNEYYETIYTLKLGFPLSYDSGVVINSTKGTTLPYSESSLPWKKFENITNLELADGVKYGGRCGKALYWEIDGNGTLVVSGTGDMEFESYNAPWSIVQDMIKKVVVSEGATSIADRAFWDCGNLTEVELSDSVLKIGSNAFGACDISSVTLPENLELLGESVFGYNSNLAEINISANNGHFSTDGGVLLNKAKTEIYLYPAGKTDESYTLLPGIVKINNYAFEDAKLKSVVLNEGLVSIGEGAFQSSDIISINIPASVSEIGDQAFDYCYNMKEIVVSEGNAVYSSEDGILYNKTKTELVLYPVKKAGTDFTVPSTVEKIGFAAMSGVVELISIAIPDSVKEIESCAFTYCENLVRINIPASVTKLGDFIINPDSEATVFCEKDSVVHEYCEQMWLKYSLNQNDIAAKLKWQGKAKITVALPSEREKDGYVIAAVYDYHDNSLIEVKKIKVESDVVNVSLEEDGAYIKVLWVDVNNTMAPLSDAVMFE